MDINFTAGVSLTVAVILTLILIFNPDKGAIDKYKQCLQSGAVEDYCYQQTTKLYDN